VIITIRSSVRLSMPYSVDNYHTKFGQNMP